MSCLLDKYSKYFQCQVLFTFFYINIFHHQETPGKFIENRFESSLVFSIRFLSPFGFRNHSN
jgi:hypothetical protein